MARLTEEQWGQVRAEYEVSGLSFGELSKKYGINKSNISRKARSSGWIQGASQHCVDRKYNAIKELGEIRNETQQLTQYHQAEINNEVSFKLQNDKDLQAIQDVVNQMIGSIDNPAHALALMNATVKHREARLGKSPDTAIQINNVIDDGTNEW